MDFTDILERLYEAEIDKFLPHIKDDLSQMFTKTLKYIDNNSKYINPIDGDIYQLKTLILYLYRGISHKYSFRLDTEVKKAKQFNNLIFKYIQNDNNFHRVLQVKYKLDKTEKITAHNLLEENEGDYSLVKYFFSYQDLKADKSINNGLIKNFTVCTNINFDFKNLTEKRIEVQRLKSIDYILKLRSDQKQSIRYKFKQDMGQLLKKKLLEFRAHESNKITGHLDDEIKDFLNNFIFAVEQPSEEELIEIINQEIGEEFDFITTENLYNKFFMKMLDWLQSKEKNTFLSYLKGKEFFEEMKNQFHNQLRFKECINQFKILILFLHRGISHEYSFQLGIKPKDFQQFDHLIFKYIQNDISIYHLLQVKYKLDESKKITAYNLLEENEGDYSLIKYFFAYQEFKVDKSFEGGSIKYFTVCTNINFNFKDLNNSKIKVQKLKNVEDIFSFEKYNGNTSIELMLKPSARYKFNINMISSLKSKLACNTDRSPEQLHDEIKEFLDHFIFAIEQPSEKELNKIIKLEMGKEFNLISIKNANNFLNTMFNSLQDKNIHTFLSHDEGNKFLDKIKKLIHIWFDIENPIESFTGRIEELNNLHSMLQSQDNISKSNIVFVSGHNGIGKTQLVKKYISINSQSYDNKIIWINAENYESLAGSFWKLATNELKIATKRYCKNRSWEKDIRLLIEDVYRYFSKGKCLFVFDVQKYKLECRIKNFFINLQSYYKHPHIIITSRTQKGPKNIKVIDLHIFKKEEAINFVGNSLSINSEHKSINELVEKLQFLPLILQLAVAYIKTQKNNSENLELIHHVDDYIKNFIRKTSEYVNSDSIEDSDNDYSKTTYSVYHMTLDAIRESEYGEYALMILNVMSYLDSNNVPVEIMFELIKDKKRLDSAIELLKEYSVIGVQNNKLFLHRIIQQITRSQLANQHKEQEILVESIKLFDKVTDENVDCAISIWNHIGKYNNLIERYSNFMNSISFVLIKNGRYEEAYSFEQKKFIILNALPQSNEELKIINDHNLIMTKNNIAYLMIKQGKYDLALENFKYIYNIGLDHSDTWSVQNSIALTLVELNKATEAAELCKEVLEQQKIVLGENDCYTLLTKEILGRIYINFKKPDKSLPILNHINQMNYSKKNSIDYARIKNYMAISLMQLNKKEKSLRDFSAINKILNNLSPMYYSAIIFLKHNAALMLNALNENYAVTIYEEILKIQKKILEENHPDILVTKSAIAKIYTGHEQEYSYKSALVLYKKIYDELRNTADFLDPNFLDIQYNKALSHQHLGEYNDALALFRETLTKQNIIFGEKHKNTLETVNHIAMIHLNLYDIDKALELFKKNLILQQGNSEVEDLKILTTKYYIGKSLHMKRNFDEAVPIFEELITKFSALSTDLINMTISIALMLFRQQNYDKALEIFEKVYNKLKTHETNEKHLQVETYINAILWIQGKYKKMDDSLEKVFKTELLDSMKNNDFDRIKNIIEVEGVDIKNDDKIPIVCYAVSNKQDEILSILLERGANLDVVDSEKNTALHIATLKKHVNIIEILLNKIRSLDKSTRSSFVNCKNQDGSTALHLAAKNGSFDIVRLLLIDGAIYNSQNSEDQTALELSTNDDVNNLLKSIDRLFKKVKSGDSKIINSLKTTNLDDIEIFIETQNHEKQTLIEYAKFNKHNILANELLKIIAKRYYENDVDVDAKDPVAVDKLLSAALVVNIKNNDFRKIRTLIELGGNVNATDEENFSILYHAAVNNQMEIVNFLLYNGANSRQIFNNNITILYAATSGNHKNVVELLLKKNPKNREFYRFVNIKTVNDGTTPLHIAAKNDSLDIVKFLLKNGASYDIKNKDRKTALELSKNESIKSLLKSIDELFQDVTKGHLRVDKLEALELDEYEALIRCTNCKEQTVQDIIKLRKNGRISDKVFEIYRKKCKLANQSTKK